MVCFRLEGQNFSPAFLKISPRGTVPALVIRKSTIPYQSELPGTSLNRSWDQAIANSVSDIILAYEETLDESKVTKYKSVPDSIAAADALDNFTLSNASGPRLSPATIQGSQDAKVCSTRFHPTRVRVVRFAELCPTLCS